MKNNGKADKKIFRLNVGIIGTNCWIIPLEGKDCLVVDPGGDGDKILSQLAQWQFCPRYIALTHAHLDHIAALPELAAAWPEAAIAVHPAEAGKLGPQSLETHREDFRAVGAAGFAEALWKPLPTATLLVNEGDSLGPFCIMHVPGHSAGSIALHWEEEKILISGDTLFHAGAGRTDLYGGDTEQLSQSLARLFTLDADTAVYPGHGPTTTIDREKKRYVF